MTSSQSYQKRLRLLLQQLKPSSNPSSSVSSNTSNNDGSSRKVSIVSDISCIYDADSLSFQQERFSSLLSKFSSIYKGARPDFIIRSPGRVNLIGEHVDYCGYDVLPMAVEKDIIFLCKLDHSNNSSNSNSDIKINLCNTETKFATKIINLARREDTSIDLSGSHRDWTDYFKAGLSGASKQFGLDLSSWKCGLNILVDGNVPKGSGLSSSSAFVCASLVSILVANGVGGVIAKNGLDLDLDCKKIATAAMVCEKEVGVDAGGMDQTICVMASKGYAKHIEFVPSLQAKSVKLPDANEYSFVIANCLKAHKLMDNDGTRNYNTRVVECRLATLIVARKLGLKNWQKIATMRELQDTCGVSLDEMIRLCLLHLDSEPYCLGTVEKALGIDFFNPSYKLEDFMFGLKTGKVVVQNLRKLDYKLPLQCRMLHVYKEAKRVRQFADICNNNGTNSTTTTSHLVAKRLGQLMNDSHASCDELYDCSCGELNSLQAVCLQAGSLGSRLTGAGWGGCVVSLVSKANVKKFIETVRAKYYSNIEHVPQGSIFETSPSAALTVVKSI